MPPRPIVYTGPSVSHGEAAEALPGADLRGSIRRWDLYRDREEGGSVFVILDGVFFQQEAVSPREVLDVVADGGLVVGASSMGAMRAAECWPAGMIGIGTVYRLFRRGLLASDDEVAVIFSPGEEAEALSVPLVNVRYAASRAIRQGWLEREPAHRLVRAAEETFYAERSWPELLSRAGLPASLEVRLAACNLKKMDGLRALRRVARWLTAAPELAIRPRRREAPLEPRDGVRERGHDALGGADPEEVRHGLARWLLLSGRGTRHLLAVAAARPELRLEERLRSKMVLGSLVEELRREPRYGGIAGPAAVQMALFDLWVDLAVGESGFAEGVWAELAFAGDLDAEVLRYRAFREGVETARRLGLTARGRDRYLAEMEIANAHGFPAWRDLRDAVRRTSCPWMLLVELRNELALAKRLRDRLFNPPP
jgi:hypothetical protein